MDELKVMECDYEMLRKHIEKHGKPIRINWECGNDSRYLDFNNFDKEVSQDLYNSIIDFFDLPDSTNGFMTYGDGSIELLDDKLIMKIEINESDNISDGFNNINIFKVIEEEDFNKLKPFFDVLDIFYNGRKTAKYMLKFDSDLYHNTDMSASFIPLNRDQGPSVEEVSLCNEMNYIFSLIGRDFLDEITNSVLEYLYNSEGVKGDVNWFELYLIVEFDKSGSKNYSISIDCNYESEDTRSEEYELSYSNS